MNITKMKTLRVFSGFCLVVLLVNALWFISSSSPMESDSALRMVLGAIVIFLLPGLIWGEILGFRSDHFLETIALSFALTLSIEIVLLPIPFFSGSGIGLWVGLLLSVCLSGLFILNFKRKAEKELTFIKPLLDFFKQPFPLNVSASLIIIMLLAISYGVYCWGESLRDISGEKFLHMIFVRYYYSMPMVLNNLGVYQGAPPPNLVQLWEYLIAGWASLTNMDPLVLFYRARFVIPVLGFSGMYLLIKNIFSNVNKVEIVFLGVSFICLGWFVLLSPSNLDWVKSDPSRGIMSFMGTVHHSDAAMDLLIALSAGLVMATFRCFDWRNIFILTGVLVGGFMWHPREFFQVAIYAGIFGITLLSFPGEKKALRLKKWAGVMVVFFVIAGSFFVSMSALTSPETQGYDELKIKKLALTYAFSPENITGIRTLFNFPLHLVLSSSADPDAFIGSDELWNIFSRNWNYNLWLLLSAMALPLLAFLGKKEDRQFSLFLLLLWFIVLCWNFSMLLLIVLTYSEFHMVTLRVIYIFSYIVIIDGLYLISRAIYQKKRAYHLNPVFFLAFMLGLGLFFKWWWAVGVPYAKGMSFVLSGLALISLIWVLTKKKSLFNGLHVPPFASTVCGLFLFFLPILWTSYSENIDKIIYKGRPSIDLLGNENPFGLSSKLVRFVRSLPPQQTFLVNPNGTACIPVLTSQYVAVVPKIIGTMIHDRAVYTEVAAGRHPLFNFQNAGLKRLVLEDRMPTPPIFNSHTSKYKSTNFIEKGKFSVTLVSNKDENIIRLVPIKKSERGELEITMAFEISKNKVPLGPQLEHDLVFTVSSRLSQKAVKWCEMFILDKTETPEVSSVGMDNTSWDQYVVSKRIRDGATQVALGVSWMPENLNEWMEIKDVRIYVADETSPQHEKVDHNKVTNWLDSYKVNYILIEKEHYSRLLPYFRKFSEDYRIIFDNPEQYELIVEYVGRTDQNVKVQ